jgi:hypothetical protein
LLETEQIINSKKINSKKIGMAYYIISSKKKEVTADAFTFTQEGK